MPLNSGAEWVRLGKLLIQRRVALDADFYNRRTFCEERGLEYKLVTAIENGNRPNARRSTLHAIENAYRLRRGSMDAALGGGQLIPEEAPDNEQAPPWAIEPWMQTVWYNVPLPADVRLNILVATLAVHSRQEPRAAKILEEYAQWNRAQPPFGGY